MTQKWTIETNHLFHQKKTLSAETQQTVQHSGTEMQK
jgi:hypothetical protein